MDVYKIKQAYTSALCEVGKFDRVLALAKPDMPDTKNVRMVLGMWREDINYIRGLLNKSSRHINKIK